MLTKPSTDSGRERSWPSPESNPLDDESESLDESSGGVVVRRGPLEEWRKPLVQESRAA
jgi:hypothetical protein